MKTETNHVPYVEVDTSFRAASSTNLKTSRYKVRTNYWLNQPKQQDTKSLFYRARHVKLEHSTKKRNPTPFRNSAVVF